MCAFKGALKKVYFEVCMPLLTVGCGQIRSLPQNQASSFNCFWSFCSFFRCCFVCCNYSNFCHWIQDAIMLRNYKRMRTDVFPLNFLWTHIQTGICANDCTKVKAECVHCAFLMVSNIRQCLGSKHSTDYKCFGMLVLCFVFIIWSLANEIK